MINLDHERLDPSISPTIDDVVKTIHEAEWWQSGGAETMEAVVRAMCSYGVPPVVAASLADDMFHAGAAEYGN